MAIALSLSPKRLWLILEAVDARIAAEEDRYTSEDPAEDAAGDFGNDLWNLKAQREELATLYAGGAGTAIHYQCWFDPEDSGLALLRFQDVQRNRDQGQLSNRASLQYEFTAHTGEEAMAIHSLRQGWAPYLPTGEAGDCPACGSVYYPECYGDCWRCGHIG
jgi:hypothetical protein